MPKALQAIRAVRNPIGLIFVSIAVAILVLSMSHANTEFVMILLNIALFSIARFLKESA